MHTLVVALGEADFYYDAARLQCHTTLNATICCQRRHAMGRGHGHDFGVDETVVDVHTLNTLGLFYRVSRPLYLDFDLCCEAGLSQGTTQASSSSRIGRLIARQASSDQFWRQMNFRSVSVHTGADDTSSRSPFLVQFRLGLEHVDYNSSKSSSSQGSSRVLSVNDINYPDCLEIATLTQVSLRLLVRACNVGRPFHAASAEATPSIAIPGRDSTAAEFNESFTAPLHDFVDAAIRCSISSARHRLAPGIRKAAPGFQHTLQTTFPTIFSPLGAQYLAERHPLVSGVANSILRCLDASSGGRLSNLQRLPEAHHGLHFEDIQSRLWECLATGSRDAQGRLVLQPLLLSGQDSVIQDQGSPESLFHVKSDELSPAVNITNLFDYEDTLGKKSVRRKSVQLEGLDQQEKTDALNSELPDVSRRPHPDNGVCESTSITGSVEEMLMDDECKGPVNSPHAEDECLDHIWDDKTGDARSPSQTYRQYNVIRSDGDSSGLPVIQDFSHHGKIDPADQVLSSTCSYMFNIFPSAQFSSPEKTLTRSSSFTDLDLLTPYSTQPTDFPRQDICHQQSPVLGELLCEDDRPEQEWWESYDIVPKVGSADVPTNDFQHNSSALIEAKPSLLRRRSLRSNASSDHDMMDSAFLQIQDQDFEISPRNSLTDCDHDNEMLFD